MSSNGALNGASSSSSSSTALQRVMRATTALLSRVSWMSRAGLMYDGNRDLWKVFGYKRALTIQDLYVKFRRQDVATRIAVTPADALWTRPPKLSADSTFETAWKDLTKQVPIWDSLNRADISLSFSRFSVIVIGLDDGLPLDQPVRGGRQNKVIYLQPYSELGVEISKWETNPSNPRFGKPLYYQIDLNQTDQSQMGRTMTLPSVSFRVHWSRIIHLADNVIEDEYYGIPRLEPVYNVLDDMLKVTGGSAETYWLTANRGMQVDVDKEMPLDGDDAEALEDEITEYVHGLVRFIKTRGVKIQELGTRVASSKDPFSTCISLLSANTGIPQRMLLGSEAGQLASEQDRANWAERVGERRTKFGEPRALSQTVKRLVDVGALPIPQSLRYVWPEAFILAPLERAQTAAQMARSAANLSRVLTDHPEGGAVREDGSVANEFITVDEARRIVGLGNEARILEETETPDASLPQN